jgi:hypothetical protein
MNVLGIDPGAKGGMAIINSTSMKLVRGIRMPTYKLRGKTLVSGNGVLQFCDGIQIDVGVIEQQSGRPGQSSVATFSFGRSTGAIEIMTTMVAEHCEWVTAQKWKKHFHLSSNKRESLDAVKIMFGDTHDWSILANDGIAEAALIARWWIDNLH